MRCRPGAGVPARGIAFEQYGIEPDVIIASKGLSGLGLPVSVILYRSRLDRWGPGSHIGTFRGNNLAFASGNAYLEVLRRENLLENVRAQGRHLLTALAGLQRSTSLISDVRGLGLILGMEMAAYPAASVTAGQVAARVQRAALRRGLIVEVGGRGRPGGPAAPAAERDPAAPPTTRSRSSQPRSPRSRRTWKPEGGKRS